MRKKWLKQEDDYLIKNYQSVKSEEICLFLNRSLSSVQSRASELGLKKVVIDEKNKIWSSDEIEFLLNNYIDGDKETLINKLNRSWSSIQNKAFLLKIKRDVKNCNVFKLIDGSNEAFYWLGFIMADGHFNKNKMLEINLSIKDYEHLVKFSKFIEYSKKLVEPSIKVSISDIYDYLKTTFNVSSTKTYNPCNLEHLSGDSFFSFIIGFIDGDGCITKQGYLTIKCHKSWETNLNKMISFLSNGKTISKCVINKENLALITLTQIEITKKIKNKALSLKLPVLTRKWDNISFDKYSKTEKSLMNQNICFDLFNKNIPIKDVITITKLSKSQVYLQLKKYKLAIKEKDIQKDLKKSFGE
jgi:hypothetical protein